MIYHLYDLQHAVLTPARIGAELMRTVFRNPLNPMSYTQAGRTIAAGAEVFERMTSRFGKPSFELPYTHIDGKKIEVVEEFIVEKPFANLLHFKRRKTHRPKSFDCRPYVRTFCDIATGNR
jgi:poly(3-hydroxybutyrate) depolymerase